MIRFKPNEGDLQVKVSAFTMCGPETIVFTGVDPCVQMMTKKLKNKLGTCVVENNRTSIF